jgi:glucokinase
MNQSAKFSLPKTISQAEMRRINRSAILEYLRLSAATSRTEMANQLELSLPSVKRIVDQLMAEGLVVLTGQKEKGRGRSRELLSLNLASQAVIGIDVGGSHIRGALVNIGGEFLFEDHQSQKWAGPEENFEIIQTFIHALLEKSQAETAHLLGIGIGIPGIVAAHTGTVILAPSLGWENYPFLEKLAPQIDIPVFVENDVALAALGESWFGAGIGIKNLVMIAIGTGIGAGVLIDGKLYRGHSHSAGEIGHFLPGLEYLNNEYPGFGALESLASGKGIADRANTIIASTQTDGAISSQADLISVLKAAQNGESWASQLVQETIDYYSLMIANLSLCYDPELIIIGGGVADSFDALFEPIFSRLEGVIPNIPSIQKTALRSNAPILGAVAQVFQKVTGYLVVQVA